MKKLSRFIYILLVYILLLAGCNNRSYIDSTIESGDISVIVTPSSETTAEEPPTTEEPTTPAPTPYELLLASEPINNDGNMFFMNSVVPLTEDSYIVAFFEWQEGFFLAVCNIDSLETTMYYLDIVDQKIFETVTLSAPSANLDMTALDNGNIMIIDMYNHCFYLYDKQLVLLSSYPFPASSYMTPVISKNSMSAYYSDEDGAQCYRLDLETGVAASIITANEGTSIYPCELITYDNVELLVLSVYDDFLCKTTYEYYNPNGPEFIKSLDSQALFESCGDGYGVRLINEVTQLLYLPELREESAKELCLDDFDEYYSYWFQPNKTLITSTFIDGNPADTFYNYMHIRVYDLDTGLCSYETKFHLDNTMSGAFSRLIYSSRYNAIIGVYESFLSETFFLLWDLNSGSSVSDDKTVYLSKYYSSDEINWDGITALKSAASEISRKYGVNICIADDSRIDTGDYTATQVFHTALIRNALTIVDEALSNYPKDFFTQLQGETGFPLEINLSGTISPVDGYDSINTAIGLHNYNYGNQYVILDITNLYLLETTIYHEIFHAIDWIVVFNSTFFDGDWFALNPDDFEYDYGYTSNESNNDSTYLYYTDEGYFIDIYSKSFPNEDRARIIENAMSGNRYYFESKGLYNKLSYICQALREVFDSSTWEETTRWEAALLPIEEDLIEILPEDIPESY